MNTPWEIINENMINISSTMNDFFDTVNEKDIEWVAKDANENVINITIPNVAKQNRINQEQLNQKISDLGLVTALLFKTLVSTYNALDQTAKDSIPADEKTVINDFLQGNDLADIDITSIYSGSLDAILKNIIISENNGAV